MTSRWRPFLAAASLALPLASMVMVVAPGQVAVVERFGAPVRVQQAGLGLRLPFPVESDRRVQVTEVRRVELPRGRFLTSDHNLVDLSLVVQYAVAEPVAYATRSREPEALIAAEAGAAATEAVGRMAVDALLTTGRAEIQRAVQERAQGTLDALGLGVRLVAVDARELVPPGAVVDAFNDVSSARGDRETIALAADAYVSKLLPDVRGQAARRVEEGRAAASRTTARAESRTGRFQRLVAQHRAEPAATRAQLHREALRTVSPRLRVIVAPRGTEVVLPNPDGAAGPPADPPR